MMRCYFMALFVVGFATLAACGGASNGAFAPRVPAAGVRPLSVELYSFGGSPDGEWPQAGLLAGKQGKYYGTTVFGGNTGNGTVYQITGDGKEKVIYSFQGGAADGALPQSTLIMDKEGTLYGETERGGLGGENCGQGGCGTVFKLTPGKQGWTESVLYEFQSSPNDGAYPLGGLLMTKNGVLLGTSSIGGANTDGTVFELKPSGSRYKEKVIHSFTGADGESPADALISDSNGNLYGTTFYGGLGLCCGTVFKLTLSGSTYTESAIHSFKGGPDGEFPTAGLLRGPRGVFYGLTGEGGVGNNGTVFELAPKGSSYREKPVYSFKGGADGTGPVDTPGLVADRDGDLYGTTAAGGGTCDCGTVFKLVPAGNGFTEHVLYAFQGGDGDGEKPYGSVVIDHHGNLLGPTFFGGYSNSGTIFSLCCAPPPR